uniref:C2H2-type domain-containing protein n=1 Tax=Mesocestoides corti TaxID=53468 RepID=A0A5K3FDU7_MESCO
MRRGIKLILTSTITPIVDPLKSICSCRWRPNRSNVNGWLSHCSAIWPENSLLHLRSQMAETTSFDYQETIFEGFICPSCLKSFGRPELLEDHFSKEHFHINSNYENSVKYVKAPPLGKIRCRTAEFGKLRRVQVDRTALETNLLLIRLGKLSNIPDNIDTNQRHSMEQAIVPWIDAKINLCPRCGVPFGLSWPTGDASEDTAPPLTSHSLLLSPPPTSFSRRARIGLRSASRLATALIDNNPVYRRMHHCRLCGHIICADCSYFLSKHDVRQIVEACDWAAASDSKNTILPPDLIPSIKDNILKRGVSYLSRSSSGTSLDSIVQKRSNPPDLRICGVCKSILEAKMQRLEEDNAVPLGFEQFQVIQYFVSFFPLNADFTIRVASRHPFFRLNRPLNKKWRMWRKKCPNFLQWQPV